ncbi:MAG: hypothetical protein ACFB10_22000 [Salibacteraceae bacterium]
MLVSENHRLRLVYDDSVPILIASFNGFIDFDDFARDMQKVGQVVLNKNCLNVLFDVSKMADRGPLIMDWIESHCLPQICSPHCNRLLFVWDPYHIPPPSKRMGDHTIEDKRIGVYHFLEAGEALSLAREPCM